MYSVRHKRACNFFGKKESLHRLPNAVTQAHTTWLRPDDMILTMQTKNVVAASLFLILLVQLFAFRLGTLRAFSASRLITTSYPSSLVLNKDPPLGRQRTETAQANGNAVFNWTDVDMSRNGICGWHKCFFPAVSDPTKGYLVASRKHYKKMKKGIEIALELESKYGCKHFHVEMATTQITDRIRERIISRVDQPARRVRGRRMGDVLTDNNVVVQTVRRAPEPSLFFASMRASAQLMLDSLANFSKFIPDKTAFRSRLLGERSQLEKVLRDRPELSTDFQALIDTSGNLYLIDLENFVRWQSRARTKNRTLSRAANVLKTMEQVAYNLTFGGEVTITF